MTENPMPSARPVPAEAVVERTTSSSGSWARGLGWMFGAWALIAVVWRITDVEVFYGAVVAMTALGVVGEGTVTLTRALKYLSVTAGIALAGVLLLGSVGVGLGTGQRVVQGAGGLVVAALVLLLAALVQRRKR